MLASQILQSKGDLVFTVTPIETVEAAAALLHSRRVGALVVVDSDQSVIGIVSERDIVRVVAETGTGAMAMTLTDCMSRDVIFADPSETVDVLMGRMTDRRLRHLPVVSGGRLLGIISIGDLVKAKIAEVESEASGLKAYIAL